MFDKEIEAIAKCTELIKELDNDSKMRVIKYLIERFGLNQEQVTQVVTKPPIEHRPLLKPTESTSTIQIEDSGQYPMLKDLLVKDYPKNEPEWILCYAFYSSKFGKETFSKEDILARYKDSSRGTKNNLGNLGYNISACIKKDWIKSANETDYILKSDGIDYVKEVLKGNSTGKEKSAPSVKAAKVKTPSEPLEGIDVLNNEELNQSGRKKSSKPVKVKAIQPDKFEYTKTGSAISINEFWEQKRPSKATGDIVAVIGYYVQVIRGSEGFTEGNIDFAYRILNLKGRPKHLRQILINNKNRKDLFEEVEGKEGTWKLTRGGEIFVEEQLPSKS